MNRYVCIHGHFYQPPRENPWLEHIEHQASAYPYHDWNEKISEECYTPNTASRLVNKDNKIIDIINNFEHISFNIGPTLLSWMEEKLPDTYTKIIGADGLSMSNYSGHGSAIAQAYNHMILPLANTRDKITQVRWGIRDFEKRFSRSPEGMWLPETAVNLDSLEVLAEHGIKFTILAPRQADGVRKLNDAKWTDVKSDKIDPKRAYVCNLPSGKSINLFFYDGPVSQGVGFEKLLSNGKNFAKRLISLFENAESPQLVNIATDGETYGHHHKYGDMSLAYCIQHINELDSVKMTNYGEFLERHPPEYEVRIIENSSWSCVHGIERWKSDCGCSSLQHADWNQKWREPLRNALDWLRDMTAEQYEKEMQSFAADPRALRNGYIDIILNRTDENIGSFLEKHLPREINEDEKIKILKLLEMERHALLMYTSCGWFFDDVSGIETTQILKYSARVIQLLRQTTGIDGESDFLNMLAAIPTNLDKLGNGRQIYELFVKPSSVDMLRVCAHFAMSSLFEEYAKEAAVYCYVAKNSESTLKVMGNRKYILGRVELSSTITYEKINTTFAVVYLGDHNLTCGIRKYAGEKEYAAMKKEILDAFTKNEVPLIIRLLLKYFRESNFSIDHLFRHEQDKVYTEIFSETTTSLEASSRQIYAQYYPLLQAQKGASFVFPEILLANIEFVINRDIITILESENPDSGALEEIANNILKWSFKIDNVSIEYTANMKMNELMLRFSSDPSNKELLTTIKNLIIVLNKLELQVNLWRSQNTFITLIKRITSNDPGKEFREIDAADREWVSLINDLAALLYIDIRL